MQIFSFFSSPKSAEMAPKKGIKKIHKGIAKSKNELRYLKNDSSFTSTTDTSFSSDCSDCDCSDCDCSDCYDQCPLTSRKSSKGRKSLLDVQNNPHPLAAVPHAIVIPVVMEIATIARHQKVKLVVKIRHNL
ncbi:hypothetical protein HZH66_012581 [Vespula vulgaris]|uniref:Uncharacterized protein n=1 Tax=Vespula vulgaris TaxID=7454 RepID=A0A834JEU2_VESVU|nr:hypothetical protein HZH66_012581 [Vespula vulgaris]